MIVRPSQATPHASLVRQSAKTSSTITDPKDSFSSQHKSELVLIPKNLAPSAKLPFARKIEDLRKDLNVPSLSGFFSQGTKEYEAVSGVRVAGTSQTVESGDKFHLGSCSKAMTSTMLARLVEKGQLRWDTTLAEVFPDLAEEMNTAFQGVTLTQLTSHTSGIKGAPDHQLWNDMFFEATSREEIVQRVSAGMPTKPGQGSHEYSNFNYILAGAMAERVSGSSWEELMQTEVFEPLGITTAGYGPAGEQQPWGHNAQGTPVNPDYEAWVADPDRQGPPPDNPPSLGPAGTVHMSVADWGKFSKAHRDKPADFLNQETWNFLHTPAPGVMPKNPKVPGTGGKPTPFTPGGWVAGDDGSISHDGSNTMNYAAVRIQPSTELKQGSVSLLAMNKVGQEKNWTGRVGTALYEMSSDRP